MRMKGILTGGNSESIREQAEVAEGGGPKAAVSEPPFNARSDVLLRLLRVPNFQLTHNNGLRHTIQSAAKLVRESPGRQKSKDARY